MIPSNMDDWGESDSSRSDILPSDQEFEEIVDAICADIDESPASGTSTPPAAAAAAPAPKAPVVARSRWQDEDKSDEEEVSPFPQSSPGPYSLGA